MQSANLPDDEKSATIKEAEIHLHQASLERSLYTGITKLASANLPPGTEIGPHRACCFDGMMHYSFDFAQQVHYSSQVQSTSKHPENVDFSAYVVKLFQSRLIF